MHAAGCTMGCIVYSVSIVKQVRTFVDSVVKLLSKRWWIAIGAVREGPKLEPEGSRADVGFPTADQGFSSIQGTLFGFYGI